MTILPEQIRLREVQHGHGDHGRAHIVHEDIAGMGVVVVTSRESWRAVFQTRWMFKWFPGREFNSYALLRQHVNAELTVAMMEDEKAKWPVINRITELAGREWPNKCIEHRDMPAVFQVSIATCWIPNRGEIASVCQECYDNGGKHAIGLAELLQRRRERVAAKRA